MPKKYDDDQLRREAAAAWCMTDFLARIGVEVTPRVRRNMWQRLSHRGIDTSHWDRSPHRTYRDEQLAEAVAASVSMAEVLRRLEVPNTGGQHAHLSRRVKRAGLDTSHFLGQAHFRGR